MSDTDDPIEPRPPEADGTAESPDAPPHAGATDPAAREPVGYGRPPREHQYKKNDGRKRGRRPKGSRNAKTILRQEHNRQYRFHDGKRTRRKPAIELMIRGDVAAAVKQEEKAKARQLALALRLADEDEAKAAMKLQRDLLAEDEAILARYLPAAAKPDDPASDGSNGAPA